MTDHVDFALDRSPAFSAFDVRTLLEDVCAAAETEISARSIVVEIDASHGMSFTADPELVHRALTDLVFNALDAMPAGGELLLTAVITHRGLELEVADSGPGLPQPLSGDALASGTTADLSTVNHIARAHGGEIAALNCAQGGTAYTICLPRRVMKHAA